MKIHDFGLWFAFWVGTKFNWSTTITMGPKYGFAIYYDGVQLGCQDDDLCLEIYVEEPHIIKLKKDFPLDSSGRYIIDRLLTLDDFEIIENHDYRGNQ